MVYNLNARSRVARRYPSEGQVPARVVHLPRLHPYFYTATLHNQQGQASTRLDFIIQERQTYSNDKTGVLQSFIA